MSWMEIEKRLEALEEIESYSKEEQAEILASITAQLIYSIPKEQLVPFLKQFILANPDMLDNMIDFYKNKLLRQYREQMKKLRRKSKIKFK